MREREIEISIEAEWNASTQNTINKSGVKGKNNQHTSLMMEKIIIKWKENKNQLFSLTQSLTDDAAAHPLFSHHDHLDGGVAHHNTKGKS